VADVLSSHVPAYPSPPAGAHTWMWILAIVGVAGLMHAPAWVLLWIQVWIDIPTFFSRSPSSLAMVALLSEVLAPALMTVLGAAALCGLFQRRAARMTFFTFLSVYMVVLLAPVLCWCLNPSQRYPASVLLSERFDATSRIGQIGDLLVSLSTAIYPLWVAAIVLNRPRGGPLRREAVGLWRLTLLASCGFLAGSLIPWIIDFRSQWISMDIAFIAMFSGIERGVRGIATLAGIVGMLLLLIGTLLAMVPSRRGREIMLIGALALAVQAAGQSGVRMAALLQNLAYSPGLTGPAFYRAAQLGASISLLAESLAFPLVLRMVLSLPEMKRGLEPPGAKTAAHPQSPAPQTPTQ